MEWAFTPFAAPLFVGGVFTIGLTVAAIRRRGIPGAIPMAALTLALTIYAVAYGLEIGSLTPDGVRFWLKVEYLGIAFAPGLLLLFIVEYLGYRRLMNPVGIAALFVIPAITCVLAWTNETHQLIWQGITIDRAGGFTRTLFGRGSWYLVHNVFIYMELLAALVIMLRAYLRASGVYRRQLTVLLIAVLVVVLVDVLYLSGLVFPGLDLNPYGLIVTAGFLGWGMLNYRILDVVPVAREAVLRSMADAVLVFDAHNQLVDLNPAVRKIVDDPVVAIGRKFAEIFPDWPPELTSSQVHHVAHKEIPLEISGEERIFDMVITPVMSRPDKTEGRVVVLRDVTRRVLAQDALEQTNQRLKTLSAAGAELNRSFDPDDLARVAVEAAVSLSEAEAALLARVGPEGCRVLYTAGGYDKDLIGKILPGDRGIVARVVRRRKPDITLNVVDDPDYVAMLTPTRAQMTLPLKAGERLFGVLVLETSRPEDFSQEVFEAIVLLNSSVAVALENAQINESRDQLVKDLDSFAHTVAHDLKNPLAAIRGYAELIGLLKLPGDGPKYVERIIGGVKQSIGIVDALLALAQASNLENSRLVAMDMAEAVSAVMARLHLVVEQSGAEVALPETWPRVQAYQPWVEEVWANYVSNAVKYGGKPPTITLGWDEQPDHMLRFWVKDDGKGLTQDQIEKLFHPFVRLDNSPADGYGLGLSIVRRITERLGGEVGVDSVVGEGSTFYFTLPPSQQIKVPDEAAKE